MDGILLIFLNMGAEYIYYKDRSQDFFYDGSTNTGEELLLYVVSYILMVLYFVSTEYLLDGKSLGKFLTKTRVIRTNGEALTFSRVLGRSLARIIPFDAISIFFNESNTMWHDSLSDTIVVEDRGAEVRNER